MDIVFFVLQKVPRPFKCLAQCLHGPSQTVFRYRQADVGIMPGSFLDTGKMVLCTVTGIARRRPQKDQLDQANPVRNDETGLWQCPFCQQDDFPELSEVC